MAASVSNTTPRNSIPGLEPELRHSIDLEDASASVSRPNLIIGQALEFEPAPRLSLSRHTEDVTHDQEPTSNNDNDNDHDARAANIAAFEMQKARHVQRMAADIGKANRKYDPMDPARLDMTCKLLVQMGRFTEAKPLAHRLAQMACLHRDADFRELERLANQCMQVGDYEQATSTFNWARECAVGTAKEQKVYRITALPLAKAMLLQGNIAGVQAELASHAGEDNEDWLALSAMAAHSSANPQACERAVARLHESSTALIEVNLWRGRPDLALAAVKKIFGGLRERPEWSGSFDSCASLMNSPVMTSMPVPQILAADEDWIQMNECVGWDAQFQSIAVLTPLPELTAQELAAAFGPRVEPEPEVEVEAEMEPQHPFPVTTRQILDVLARMKRLDVAATARIEMTDETALDLYERIPQHYTNWNDPRINPGLMLHNAGRNLLACYFARKYGSSITVHRNIGGTINIASALPEIVAQERRKEGDVRSAHYFGTSHGVCVLYVREQQEEALLYLDSYLTGIDDKVSTEYEQARTSLINAGTPQALVDPIDLFMYAHQLQVGRYTCWAHAMKAAVTGTRRIPQEDGGLAGLVIPNIIEEFRSRRVGEPAPSGVHLVRAMPELAKMAQTPYLVGAHAAGELQTRLRDSKEHPPLEQFISQNTVVLSGDTPDKEIDVLDYARRKNLDYGDLANIEHWNQVILNQVGKNLWSEADQNNFASLMKKRMREDHAPTAVGLEGAVPPLT